MIRWIEQHINGFFKLNGFLWLLYMVAGMIDAWTNFSDNSTMMWNNGQADPITMILVPAIFYSVIFLLFSIFCFFRRYFIFPFILVYFYCWIAKTPFFYLRDMFYQLVSLKKLFEQISNNLIYLKAYLTTLYWVFLLGISIVGTILFIRKFFIQHNRFYKK